MPEFKTTARVVGVLFIVASVSAIVGGLLALPATEPGDLAAVAAAETQVVTGALIEMILVLSVVGIAVLLYPVLRHQSEGWALAYVGARTLEAALLLAAAISALVMLTLSTEAAPAGVQVVLAIREWTYLIGSVLMFGTSALILYPLLYRGNLVPAWLSLWGLAGGVLIIVSGLPEGYGVSVPEIVAGLLVAPIALNEMVLALWLIVRGFSPSSVARRATFAGVEGPA